MQPLTKPIQYQYRIVAISNMIVTGNLIVQDNATAAANWNLASELKEKSL